MAVYTINMEPKDDESTEAKVDGFRRLMLGYSDIARMASQKASEARRMKKKGFKFKDIKYS